MDGGSLQIGSTDPDIRGVRLRTDRTMCRGRVEQITSCGDRLGTLWATIDLRDILFRGCGAASQWRNLMEDPVVSDILATAQPDVRFDISMPWPPESYYERPKVYEIGKVRETTGGSSSSGKRDANSQYYW